MFRGQDIDVLRRINQAYTVEEQQRRLQMYDACWFWQKPFYAWWHSIRSLRAAYAYRKISDYVTDVLPAETEFLERQAFVTQCLARDRQLAWPWRWYYTSWNKAKRQKRAEERYVVYRWLSRHTPHSQDTEAQLDAVWKAPLMPLLTRTYQEMKICLGNNKRIARVIPRENRPKVPEIERKKLISEFAWPEEQTKTINALTINSEILSALVLQPEKTRSIQSGAFSEFIEDKAASLERDGAVKTAEALRHHLQDTAAEQDNVSILDQCYASIVMTGYQWFSEKLVMALSSTEQSVSYADWLARASSCLDWYQQGQRIIGTTLLPNAALNEFLAVLYSYLEKCLLLELPSQHLAGNSQYELAEKVIDQLVQVGEKMENLIQLKVLQAALRKLAVERLKLLAQPFYDANASFQSTTKQYVDDLSAWLLSLKSAVKQLQNYPSVESQVCTMLMDWQASVTTQLLDRFNAWRDQLIVRHRRADPELPPCSLISGSPYLDLIRYNCSIEIENLLSPTCDKARRLPNCYVIQYAIDDSWKTRHYSKETKLNHFSIHYYQTPKSAAEPLEIHEGNKLADKIKWTILRWYANQGGEATLQLDWLAQSKIYRDIKNYHQVVQLENVTNWMDYYDKLMPPSAINRGEYYRFSLSMLSALIFYKSHHNATQQNNKAEFVSGLEALYELRGKCLDNKWMVNQEWYQEIYDKYKQELYFYEVTYAEEIKKQAEKMLGLLEPIVEACSQYEIQFDMMMKNEKLPQNFRDEIESFITLCKRKAAVQLHPDKAVFQSISEEVIKQLNDMVDNQDQAEGKSLRINIIIGNNKIARLNRQIMCCNMYLQLSTKYDALRIAACLVEWRETGNVPKLIDRFYTGCDKRALNLEQNISSCERELQDIDKRMNELEFNSKFLTLVRFSTMLEARAYDSESEHSYKAAMVFLLQEIANSNKDRLLILRSLPSFTKQCAEAWRLKQQGEISFDGPAPPVEYLGRFAPHYHQQIIVWSSPASLWPGLFSPTLKSVSLPTVTDPCRPMASAVKS